jgi:membrane-anchored mycosin MYCP
VSSALVVLGPVGGPAFADQPSTSTTAQPGPQSWQPPPVNMDAVPAASGVPDGTFTQQTQCIRSNIGNVSINDRPPAQDMLNIDAAQQFSTGAGVTVAVIDTGVNPHPYLTTNNRLIGGQDYVDAGGSALVDCDGHGTIVAGIIAADTRGQPTAFTGVAPDAKILAIKQTSTDYVDQTANGTPAGDLKTLGQAIRFAADQPDVKVITMSVDDCVTMAKEQDLLNNADSIALQAAIHYAVDSMDKVVIAAAGNLTSSGNSQTDQNGQRATNCQGAQQNNFPNPNQLSQVQVPPVYADDVVSVASVDPTTGAPSAFSVWGPWVTIAAPGEHITSIDPGQGGKYLSNLTIEGGQQVSMQGTSFAAPYVAGVVALVRSRFPGLTARQVITRIEATAQHPSGASGRNNEVGYGIINPVAALTALIPGQNGVPANATTSVGATLPHTIGKDWAPLRFALLGTVGGVTLLLVTVFVTNSVRRRGQRDAGS